MTTEQWTRDHSPTPRRARRGRKCSDVATMTAPGGIRIAISMRYYKHPRGMLAQTTDATEGQVYEALGYAPITQEQHARATAKRDRDDERYEKQVERLTRRHAK